MAREIAWVVSITACVSRVVRVGECGLMSVSTLSSHTWWAARRRVDQWMECEGRELTMYVGLSVRLGLSITSRTAAYKKPDVFPTHLRTNSALHS